MSTDPRGGELAGLWESQVIHGPATVGRLLVRNVDEHVVAEIGGYQAAVRVNEERMTFALPDRAESE